MKNHNGKFKIIYSSELDSVWEDKMLLSNVEEESKILLVLADRLPRTASLQIWLAGIQSRAELIVCCLGKGTDDTVLDIKFVHDAPETYGRITARVALFDQSRFTLRGMLEITPRGKGSDTYFSAKGLLMSPRARAEIFPYLEIQTDEVRASHGTSVGRMDEKQLFYLQSRGLLKEEAEKIILADYFREAAKELPVGLRAKFFQH